MSASTEQRKLAAIMFTDMVGWGRLSFCHRFREGIGALAHGRRRILGRESGFLQGTSVPGTTRRPDRRHRACAVPTPTSPAWTPTPCLITKTGSRIESPFRRRGCRRYNACLAHHPRSPRPRIRRSTLARLPAPRRCHPAPTFSQFCSTLRLTPASRLAKHGENRCKISATMKKQFSLPRAAPSTCGRPKTNFLSAKVKSGCSEGGSPSSLGRKAPEFRTKELDGKV